ncbi:MAG: ABC transporter ATP-binding protein [Acutalibacteraceae bacterium]|nr:ABC transporter ATP-binding protein [Acutalibacteraceae bacterium]
MPVIKIDDVSKKIKDQMILDHITMEFHGGTVYGITGINGSGKTMLLRLISGLMRPSSGSVLYNDQRLYHDINFLPSIGIVIENVDLYPEFTGFQNLKMLANIRKRIQDADIERALSRVGLDPKDKRTVKKYSLGMRKKLAIAQAIMESPEVILLDEPTSALDAESVEKVRDIIKAEKERGALILLTSHNADDIRILCDEIYALQNGRRKDVQT